VSSLTDRKGVAVTVIVIGFLVVSALAVSLMSALTDQEWTRYAILASLGTMFNAVSLHLFHDGNTDELIRHADFSLRFYLLYIFGMVILGTLLMLWRYSPRDQS
jgi:Co/Zn/Cd efflux system component